MTTQQVQLPPVKGWTSRKWVLFIISFIVMCAAGYMGRLTIPFVVGLIVLPSAYGAVNVSQKRLVSSLLGGYGAVPEGDDHGRDA